jgi:hypothetical protein
VGRGSYELLLHDHEHGLVDGLGGDGISVGLETKGFDESALPSGCGLGFGHPPLGLVFPSACFLVSRVRCFNMNYL